MEKVIAYKVWYDDGEGYSDLMGYYKDKILADRLARQNGEDCATPVFLYRDDNGLLYKTELAGNGKFQEENDKQKILKEKNEEGIENNNKKKTFTRGN